MCDDRRHISRKESAARNQPENQPRYRARTRATMRAMATAATIETDRVISRLFMMVHAGEPLLTMPRQLHRRHL